MLVEPGLVQQCIDWLEHTFVLDTAARWTQAEIASSFFQPGIDPELDQLMQQHQQLENKLLAIRTN